jgi:excisionase family DNA binding protein
MDLLLAAALARGEAVRQKLAIAEGGPVSTAQAARLLGISQATVRRRWRAHRLMAWKQGRSLRFPVWQFAGGQVMKGIEEVLKIFHCDDQWRLMLYFLSDRLSLTGRRPLDLLRERKMAEVIDHAKAHAAENTW